MLKYYKIYDKLKDSSKYTKIEIKKVYFEFVLFDQFILSNL